MTKSNRKSEQIKFIDFFKYTVLVSTLTSSKIYLPNYSRNIGSHLLSIFIICGNAHMSYNALYRMFADLHLGLASVAIPLLSFTFNALVDIKWLTVWLRRAQIYDLVDGLQRIFPAAEGLSQIELDIVSKCKKKSDSFIRIQIGYFTLNCIASLVEPLFRSLAEYSVTGRFPFYYPSDTSLIWSIRNYGLYALMFGYQFINYFAIGYGIVSTNSYFFVSVLQLSMHYDLLANRVETFTSLRGRVLKGTTGSRKALCFLRDIVNRQEEILRLCQLINVIFALSILFNLLSCSLLIGCLGVTIIGDVKTFLVLYTPIIMNEVAILYMICYCGFRLTESSELFLDSIYNHDWMSEDLQYRKAVLLILTGSSRTVMIRAIGFTNVSLVTFRRVMRSTYRILAVFNSARQKT